MGAFLSSKLAARAQLFVFGLCFGLVGVLARLGSKAAGGFTGAQLTTVRFGLGTLLLLLLFRFRPGTFRPVRHGLLVLRGFLGGMGTLLYFVALARIPAGEATLLNNLYPVFATALAFFALKERPTVHLILSLLVVTLGVTLVVGPGSASLGLSAGVAICIASALFDAGAVTSIRALRATDNAPTIFFAVCLSGLAVSVPFSFGPWPATLSLWGLAIAVALLAFLGQFLMTHAYGALTVAESALWQQLTPVAGYALALLLLDERLSLLGAFGVVLGLGGVVYGSILGQRAESERPTTRTERAA